MDVLAVASDVGRAAAQLTAEEGATALFQVNLFWVIVSALNFIVFFVIIWTFAFKPVTKMLTDRRDRIEQGLKDAEQARADRENAEAERVTTLAEARKEANDILSRAQRVSQESRVVVALAPGDIEAEKQRAITELRAEVADLALAAASRVVGESLTDQRQRRLVEEFLATGVDADAKN